MNTPNAPFGKRQVSIDWIMFLYLLYILFIWLNDVLCFIWTLNYSIVLTITSALLTAGFAVIFLKEHKLLKTNINGIDIVIFFLILCLCAIRIAIPDTSFDTTNYHIYLQERPFADNVTYNFFPCRWINTFTVPLADRMFYPFRLILGYRLGVVFNTIVLTIIFSQSKRLLRNFLPQARPQVIAIFAGICILTEQILTLQCLYYVDLLPIPLLLEIVITIQKPEYERYDCIYLCLLSGLTIAIKLSNAFFIVLFAIVFIFRNYRNIHLKDIFLGIVVISLPLLPYIINAYIQTGNPFFPFYNSIFDSPYMDKVNWLDEGFGPKTPVEILVWPIQVFLQPERAYDISLYWGRLSFSYIGAVGYVIYFVIAKSTKRGRAGKQPILDSSILYIACCLVWGAFVMGMIRYALFLEVWGGALFLSIVFKFWNAQGTIKNCASLVLSLLLFFQCAESTHTVLMTSSEPGWRNSAIVDSAYWKTNAEALFSDMEYNEFIDGVDCIGIVSYNSGYAALLSSSIPVMSLNFGYANEYGKKAFQELYQKYPNIYVISTESGMDYTMQRLEEAEIRVTGEIRYSAADFISNTDRLCLIKIEMSV